MKNQLLTVLLSLGLTTSLSAQQVSVNCPEGNNWQTEKRAVVSPQWASNGVAFSGSLLYGGNGKVYLYSVLHGFYNQVLDEEFDINIIYNYEQNGCNTGAYPTNYQMVTTRVRVVSRPAEDGGEDFPYGDYTLLEILNPLTTIPSSANAYLAGWDRSSTLPSGVIIHHINYNPKMITSYTATSQNTAERYFNASFTATQTGFQKIGEGTSGAPAFNMSHRVTGPTVMGFGEDENGNSEFGAVDWMALQWNNPNSGRNLSAVLDPTNTGIMYINGMNLSELKRITTGAKYLVNKNSGFVMGSQVDDVQQSTAAIGTEDTYNCNSCQPYPEDHLRSVNRFYIMTDNNGFFKFAHQLYSAQSTPRVFTIDGSSVSDGATVNVAVSKNNPNDRDQQFRILPTGDGDNSYYIQNINSGKYLQVSNASTANNVDVAQWAYDGSNNQKWFVRNDDGSNNLMAGTMNSVGQKADATPTIAIYPVPVTDVLNLKVNGSTPVKSVTLISPLGTKTIQTVFASQSNHNITLDVHYMAAGIYYVNVLFDNGNETTAKFVKIDK